MGVRLRSTARAFRGVAVTDPMAGGVAPPRTSPPPPPQSAPGWGPPATAVQAFRRLEQPVALLLQPAGLPPAVLDLTRHEFVWAHPLAAFPVDPGSVLVATQQITPDRPSPIRGSGDDLDALLWLIGLHAFPASRAPWLGADEKFRLRRWPYFEALVHSDDQARVVKALARGFMTVDKAASSAKVDPATAQQVINALSLMTALRRTGHEPSGPTAPAGSLASLADLPPPGR